MMRIGDRGPGTGDWSTRRMTQASSVGAQLACALAGLLVAAAVSAQEIRVVAKAAATEVSVGQRFIVTIDASGPAGTSWTFPAETGDEKVALRAAPTQPPGGSAFAYEAAAFAVGEVSVPGTKVKYRLADGREGEATTEPIPLQIVSLLPKEEAERALVDIRGPVKLPLGAFFWGGLAAAAAVLALAVMLLRRRRRPKPVVTPSRPDLPPDVEALTALDALAASDLIAAADLKPFYVALAEIAKRYLERRLGAPVLEMTSAEAVTFLRDNVTARELTPPLRDLMLAADQIKFACGHSERATAERHVAAVRAMVTLLEARLRPEEAPALEKSA
jgi:hypothetical protein